MELDRIQSFEQNFSARVRNMSLETETASQYTGPRLTAYVARVQAEPNPPKWLSTAAN